MDDDAIERCLKDNQCTTMGMGATVGIFHTAGYLHWRALLNWLELGPQETYLLLLAANSAGIGLAALAALRLGGRGAAAIAALLMAKYIGLPTQLDAITDVGPLPFLGAVFVLLALAAHARPGLGIAVLLGLTAGVMASVYATCLLAGFSAVWIVLMMRPRRLRYVAATAASFAAAAFLLQPGAWVVNLDFLRSDGFKGNVFWSARRLQDIPVARFCGYAVFLWAASAARWPLLRRRLDISGAIVSPVFICLAAGSLLGRLAPEDKYCAHVIAGASVGIAVAVDWVLRGLWRWMAHRFPRLAAASFLAGAVGTLAPLAAAGIIASGAGGWDWGASRFISTTSVSFRELEAVQRILAGERGWAWPKVVRSLKIPHVDPLPMVLRWVPGWPRNGTDGDLERAYLLAKVPKFALPEPLPGNFAVVHSDATRASVLVFTCSWIDWANFKACVKPTAGGQETCTASELLPDWRLGQGPWAPGVPGPGLRELETQTLVLHFPLKPRPECPEESIVMPRAPLLCPGRIVGVDGRSSGIKDSGRKASLRMRRSGEEVFPKELAVQWEVGGPECWSEYRGHPPFFIEGEPKAVKFLEDILNAGGEGHLGGPDA